jgi:subtilisin family serine protease
VFVGGYEAVAGEVLVKFARDPSGAERLDLERLLDVEENQPIGGMRRMRSRSLDVGTLRSLLRARLGVVYAEPNYILRAIGAPDDPQFPSLWGLNNTGQVINGRAGTAAADIRAVPAWTVTTGSRANVVTVIDTGIDYTHQDLSANMWSAPASFTVTIAGVPITCAAGTHGFNAITRTCDPKDDNNHGSHVAGTIGGRGNNTLGITGINWDASIMAAKFLDASGSGSTSDAINAIEFAIQARNAFAASAGANVKVLSNSWGGGGFSQGLLDEINKANANGMLFVAAAGNSASNNDVTPSYPASFNAPNVLAVAATNNADQLASFSNFGTSVHLAAPGVDILSTTIGNGYHRWRRPTSPALRSWFCRSAA